MRLAARRFQKCNVLVVKKLYCNWVSYTRVRPPAKHNADRRVTPVIHRLSTNRIVQVDSTIRDDNDQK